jgi:hypothetical protein
MVGLPVIVDLDTTLAREPVEEVFITSPSTSIAPRSPRLSA